jgi:hypothetical protein
MRRFVALLLCATTAPATRPEPALAACPPVALFPAYTQAPTGPGAEAFVLADFDEDGELDLAAPQSSLSSLRVQRGLGSGAFAAGSALAVGAGPQQVLTADLDEDGDLDLVTANSVSSSLSICFGNGDGTFDPAVTYPTGGSAAYLAVGDFFEDGILDLAVMSSANSGTVIHRGNGSGGISDRTYSIAGGLFMDGAGLTPSAIRVVDVDHDGIVDLVASLQASGRVSIAYGLGSGGIGNGSFATPTAMPCVAAPGDVLVEDVDGDGIEDLVVGGGAGAIGFHVGLGSRSFGASVARPVSAPVKRLASADIDRDGVRDLVFAAAGRVAYLPGGAGGPGADAFFDECGFPSTELSGPIACADIDHDGWNDVVALLSAKNGVVVHPSSAPPPPASSAEFPSELWAHEGVAICALDGNQSNSAIYADGLGGMFVTWRDANGGGISIQRVLPSGATAPGWPASGRDAYPSSVVPTAFSLARDDAGGAFVVTVDARDGTPHVYGHHILADGSDDPLWGTGIALAPLGSALEARAFRDGSGGLLLLYGETLPGQTYEYRAKRFGQDGSVASSWPVDGVFLERAAPDGHLTSLAGVEDGEGGVYARWYWSYSPDCTGQHGCDPTPQQRAPYCMVRDGSVEWTAFFPGPFPTFVRSDGRNGVIANGFLGGLARWERRLPHGEIAWSIDEPVPLFSLTALVGDGLGGALVRANLPHDETATSHFFRLDELGFLACCWPSPNGTESARATGPVIADGTGGGYVVWDYVSPGTGADVFGARFSSDGAFSPNGTDAGTLLVGAAGAQTEARLISDGEQGFYLVWTDERNGTKDIYAQRFGFDPPVPVELAFVEATVGDGAVHLAWYATDAASAAFRLERAQAGGAWAEVAADLAVRGSLLEWTDRTVVAGTSYSYRLAWNDERGPRRSEPVAVSVPPAGDASVTTLLGPSRQPMRAGDRMRFRLAAAGEGTLEIFDVLGRRHARIDLSGFAAGENEFALDRSTGLRPGVYWARLAHSGVTQKLKFVYVD